MDALARSVQEKGLDIRYEKDEKGKIMRTLIEGFAYCIIIALVCFISLEMFTTHKQISYANEYYDYIEDVAIAERFQPASLDKLSREAANSGYSLKFYERKGSDSYWVELSYGIRLNLLGINKSDRINGYVSNYS